jgi:DNA-binding MarR family transcriptional regulator
VSRPSSRQFRPHVPGIAYGVLDQLTGYAIRRAQLQITEAFDASFDLEGADGKALEGQGMTTQRFSALVLIGANPGIRQTDLAEVLGIARSGALAILGALEAQGLVERRTIAADQRSHGLFLSRLGQTRLPRLVALVQAHDREVTSALTPAEQAQLKGLLSRIGGRV